MKSALRCHTLSLSAAAALLAGCGGSQLPIGAPGEMPQHLQGEPALSFMHRARGPAYRVLYSFRSRSDGMHPSAGVIDVNDALYGTTAGGGSAGKGTVYRVSPTGEERVLHSFGHGSDGGGPVGLIDVHGTLYGATGGGGTFGRGTVFSMSTMGAEKALYSFQLGSNGWAPSSQLVDANGALYGTTSWGGQGCGSTGCGVVYQISTTGSEKTMYRFKGGSAGAYLPEGRLLYLNGVVYGSTNLGGGTGCYYHHGCGTVFSITTTGKENWLYSFTGGSNGSYPEAGLIDVNGALYGTTSAGGDAGGGTVYRISTGGAESVVHRFRGLHSGPIDPETGLVHVDGMLYGTTTAGGSHNAGTVYSISPAGAVKILHNFAGGSADGLYPLGTLIYSHGTLYGTTYYGGGGGQGTCCGTVFALTL